MTLPVGLTALFDAALAKKASDIHLLPGAVPRVRVHGDLLELPEHQPFTADALENLLLPLLAPSTNNGLRNGTISSSEILITHEHFNFVLFVFRSGGTLSATVRVLSEHVPTLDQVGFECADHFKALSTASSGLILITGPVASGKQTTAFALIQEINATLPRRIHLLEESLSLRLRSERSLVSSLLVGQDVSSYEAAIRLLEWHADPDVIYLADLPDMQTVESALTAARSGHLVIANATAPSAGQALETICNALPEHLLPVLTEQILAVTNQRLFRKSDGSGRIPAYEIINRTSRLREAILNRGDPSISLTRLVKDNGTTPPLSEVVWQMTKNATISRSDAAEALRDYPTF